MNKKNKSVPFGIDHTQFYLPEEILIDKILINLPVKSLIRFKSVSKLWKSSIESPSFIYNHINHRKSAGKSYVLHGGRTEKFTLFRDEGAHHELVKHSVYEYPVSMKHAYVHGSCNGLVCFTSDRTHTFPKNTFIWNPATRQSLRVPDPLVLGHYYEKCMAFGFDSGTIDYKLLKLCRNDHKTEAEVFSLSSKSWKNLGVISDDNWLPETRPMLLNGIVYWYIIVGDRDDLWDRNSLYCRILAFDMGSERFRDMNAPDDDMSHIFYDWRYTSVIRDSLAYCRLNEDYLHIWVLEDDVSLNQGHQDYIWTKSYTIYVGFLLSYDVTVPGPSPLGFRNNGDLLLLEEFEDGVGNDYQRLWSIDLDTVQFQRFDLEDDGLSWISWFWPHHIESLVSLL